MKAKIINKDSYYYRQIGEATTIPIISNTTYKWYVVVKQSDGNMTKVPFQEKELKFLTK